MKNFTFRKKKNNEKPVETFIERSEIKEPFETITHGSNGGEDFYVNVSQKGIKVYIATEAYDEIGNWWIRQHNVEAHKKYFTKLVYETDAFEGFFEGYDFKDHHGGSVLILLNCKDQKYEYIHIGGNIYSFVTNEEIKRYYTNTGNSDRHYAYGEASDTIRYLMIENIRMDIPDDYDERNEPYEIYYGLSKKEIQSCCTPLDINIIYNQ